MAQSTPRIVYLAVADARGHLMRAHLLRRLLEPELQVDVVTTSDEGQQFLARLGCPSSRISNHFHVEFGPQHDMRFEGTSRRVARYLFQPERGLNDLVELSRLARGAAFVVNDSLHPALLAAAALGRPFRVVHVAGENLWDAACTHFDDKPAPLRRAYRQALTHARTHAFGQITHTLGPVHHDLTARSFALPPIVAEPRRLARRPDRPLAVVYLNPHYQDVAIAEAVERSLAQRGFHLYGVSEAFAGREGWVAHDSALADSIAAADVYVSGAGMAALEQARAYQTPYVALLGQQPEQRKNLEGLAARGVAVRSASVGRTEGETSRSLLLALEGLTPQARRAPEVCAQGVRAVQSEWKNAFRILVSLTQGAAHADRRRFRNQQPERAVA